MKDYPLKHEEITYLDGGGEVCGYWSKGHHDPSVFCEYLAHLRAFDPAHVRHTYYRFVPAVWYDSPPPTAIIEAREAGPGAFPVTCVEF